VVEIHTEPETFSFASRIPFQGLAERIAHPYDYEFADWIAVISTVFDYAALAGIVIAVALAAWMLWRREFGPIEAGVGAFSLLAFFLNSPGAWTEVYAFGRTLSPLLLLLGMLALSKRHLL
jgi:hypothetical protein